MKTPHKKTTTPESMEEKKQDHHHHHHHHQEPSDTTFTPTSDLCQQLLDRYGNSSASQHRHLCAAAAAVRSLLHSESLSLTPLSYFAAAVSSVADETLNSDAVAAIATFLSIALPLVPEKEIAPAKATDAVTVLVKLVERLKETVSAASARAVVKCFGVLLGFCDLDDWGSVKLGFETLLKFSIDRRPKVRKCAQDCVVRVFKLFESSTVRKEASKLVLSLLKGYMPLAVELSASGAVDVSNDVIWSQPEHLEVIHMLGLLKLIVPYLSAKVSLNVVSHLYKLMNSHFSTLTRHIFSVNAKLMSLALTLH